MYRGIQAYQVVISCNTTSCKMRFRVTNFKHLRISLVVVAITLILTGCLRKPPAPELYEGWMAMKVPDSISDLRFGNPKQDNLFKFEGYFRYASRPDYFGTLAKRVGSTKNSSSLDKPITLTLCNSPKFKEIVNDWVGDALDFSTKQCYQGVVYPYKHYIVYDPASRETYHVVDSIRD